MNAWQSERQRLVYIMSYSNDRNPSIKERGKEYQRSTAKLTTDRPMPRVKDYNKYILYSY